MEEIAITSKDRNRRRRGARLASGGVAMTRGDIRRLEAGGRGAVEPMQTQTDPLARMVAEHVQARASGVRGVGGGAGRGAARAGPMTSLVAHRQLRGAG